MSFLELARAAEERLWGTARKAREEDFSLSTREAREAPPCEKSEFARKASPLSEKSRYAHPFPDSIEGLGPRHVIPLTPCDNCGVGTWAAFGPWALCLRCANLGRP